MPELVSALGSQGHRGRGSLPEPGLGPLHALWREVLTGSSRLSCSPGHARERAQVPHSWLHRPGPREQQP